MTTGIIKKRLLRAAAAGLLLALAQGCASGPNANPADPLEPFNRTVFKFNDGLDRAIVKPLATAYRDVTPAPVRTGVNNFFGNLTDVWSLVNNVLQLKPQESVETLLRVSFNTIFGFAGVLDIATEMRLQKHTEDFGQTLGHWGVGTGPYIVLPLLGSSTVRDTLGRVVDVQADLVSRIDKVPVRNSLTTVRVVDARANLLGAGSMLEQAALDQYSFARDVYLQRRRSSVGRDEAAIEERYDLPETKAASRMSAISAPPIVK